VEKKNKINQAYRFSWGAEGGGGGGGRLNLKICSICGKGGKVAVSTFIASTAGRPMEREEREMRKGGQRITVPRQ